MRENRGRIRTVVSLVAGFAAFVGSATAASGATTALWHMDETSGTTMVDSVGSNDGTLKNIALDQSGFRGKAYGFNGSSSVVNIPSAAGLNPGSNDFGFTLHVKFTKVPSGDYDLLRKGLSSTTGGDYKMEILRKDSGASGKASCHFTGSNSAATKTAGPNLADGKWHTIACTKTASAIRLTVDGVSYSKSGSVGSISNSAMLTMGAKSSGGDWFNGLMDEVSVSN
jgi:Concanavalin A-like lectin/glucanases superfamily